jgi:hypothetical protein
MNDSTPSASPAKTLSEEIEIFRSAGHAVLDAVRTKFDARLDRMNEILAALGAADEIPPKKVRAIRDMMGVLGNAALKPAKGRLKDLKTMSAICKDLEMTAEHWS